MQTPSVSTWKYLIEVAHPWKRQLYVKGRKLPASTVWSGMLLNKLTRKQAADNWGIPVEAVDEIVSYCENNKMFLEMEAAEEKRRLIQMGVSFEPKAARRGRHAQH